MLGSETLTWCIDITKLWWISQNIIKGSFYALPAPLCCLLGCYVFNYNDGISSSQHMDKFTW